MKSKILFLLAFLAVSVLCLAQTMSVKPSQLSRIAPIPARSAQIDDPVVITVNKPDNWVSIQLQTSQADFSNVVNYQFTGIIGDSYQFVVERQFGTLLFYSFQDNNSIIIAQITNITEVQDNMCFHIGDSVLSSENYSGEQYVYVDCEMVECAPNMRIYSCAEMFSFIDELEENALTEIPYTITGYVTSIIKQYDAEGKISFYMADSMDSDQTLKVVDVVGNIPLEVGSYVSVSAQVKKNSTSSDNYETYLGSLRVISAPVTIRLNPYSVSWDEAYLYVWTGSSYYSNSSSKKLVSAQQMTLTEDGWWTYTTDNLSSDTYFYVWFSNSSNITPSGNTQYGGSHCFEYDSKSGTFQSVQYRRFEKESVTIRLNPFTVSWINVYLDIPRTVDMQLMTLAEDGWLTYTFEAVSGIPFDVYFRPNSNYYEFVYDNCTGSTCFQVVDGQLQPVEYTVLAPTEETTYTIHITTPGTLGQQLVYTLGDKSWTDVLALNITGSISNEDMKYFSRLSKLQQLDLSGTDITSIGGCKDLTWLRKVVLPFTCTAINAEAFSGCKRLNFINLDNMESIGNDAFYECLNLSSLNMPKVLSVGNYAFATDNINYQDNSSSLQSATMPLVQTIGDYAFNGNQNLASVTMPLVNTIGQYAFCNCYALAQVDLSNVTSLGADAFYMRNNGVNNISKGNLQSVTLSDELEVIPEYCFYGCDKLTSLIFPSALKEIGQGALPYLTNVQLPDGLQTVGSGNFTNATSITIPASVTSWESFSNTWTDVYCYVVSPLTFSAFNNSYAANMTLHVPAISLAAYKLHDNWYQFGQILPIEGNISELNINSDFLLSTTDGIANKANMTLNEGAALTMSASQSLALGSYVQMISSANRLYGYDYHYDTNGYSTDRYYYSYLPYTGMLLANSPMTADAVSVKLVPYSNQWNFFSLPFDVNMADITIGTEGTGTAGTSQWVIREYSGANRASGNGETWNNVPVNGILQAHKGYILYWVVEGSSSTNDSFYYYFNMPAANNANMQNIFATGDVAVPLTEYSAEFPQNRSWNLVGNPYPCSFDIQQMDFEAPITTWNGNGYTAYSPLDDNYLLRPAEGFFVQAPQGTTAITFHREGRSSVNKQEVSEEEYYDNRYYYAPRRAQANASTRKVFNFTLSNADFSDRARLVLNENASSDYELNRDAAKMLSTDKTVPQLYLSDNGIRYAINERPEGNCIFYMSAFFGKSGEYSIQLQSGEVQSTSIILTDTQTNVATDLTERGYTFTTESGTFDNRFIISMVPKMPTRVENVQGDNVQCTKMLRDGQLIIIRNGIEYNVNGQMTK